MKTSVVVAALVLLACNGERTRPEAESTQTETSAQAESMSAARVYRTTGEIRQIGDDGRVDIAHEEVEGYMPAMTMPFFGEPEQLEGLAVGDRVSFAFTVQEGGRHVLTSITKQ